MGLLDQTSVNGLPCYPEIRAGYVLNGRYSFPHCCGLCQHWRPINESGGGECHLRAPELLPSPAFPLVAGNDSCGAFSMNFRREEWNAISMKLKEKSNAV